MSLILYKRKHRINWKQHPVSSQWSCADCMRLHAPKSKEGKLGVPSGLIYNNVKSVNISKCREFYQVRSLQQILCRNSYGELRSTWSEHFMILEQRDSELDLMKYVTLTNRKGHNLPKEKKSSGMVCK